MKRQFSFYLLLLVFIFFANNAESQQVAQIKIPELEKILSAGDDRLYIVNFWATWCPPCVKELPYFQKVAVDYNNEKVDFLLVSIDFPSQIESHLKPFLKKNKVSLDVAIMMETDQNEWIDKIDPSWQGNIPATLMFNNMRKIRKFHSGDLDETELRNMIKSLL